MKVMTLCLALGALAVLPVCSAHATITYEFYVDTPAAVSPNTPNIPLNVYLQETTTNGDLTQLTPGLQSAGVMLTRTDPLPAKPTVITDAVPNPLLNDPLIVNVSSTNAWFQAFVLPDAPNGPMPTLISSDANSTVSRILLGTFFVESGDALQTTYFQLEDPDPLVGDTAPLLGSDIDPVTVTPFSITTVPEPASVGLLVGASLLLARRRK